jgi:hypothetical protein
MPAKTVVEISKSQPPLFPNRCAACGAGSPASTYEATATSAYWWHGVFWDAGPPYTVNVPTCDLCSKKIRRRERMQYAVMALIIVATIVVVLWWFNDPRGLYAYLITIGGVIISVAQLSLWDLFSPLPFSMTHSKDEVNYEFRDPDYAAEFVTLN